MPGLGPHGPAAVPPRAGNVWEAEVGRRLLVLSFQTPVHRAPVCKVAAQGFPLP